VKNQLHIKLESMLSSYVPLSILKSEYVGSLSGRVITDDKSNRWVRNSDVAAFMMSEERTAIDKNQQHMVLPSATTKANSGDEDYKDPKGKI